MLSLLQVDFLVNPQNLRLLGQVQQLLDLKDINLPRLAHVQRGVIHLFLGPAELHLGRHDLKEKFGFHRSFGVVRLVLDQFLVQFHHLQGRDRFEQGGEVT